MRFGPGGWQVTTLGEPPGQDLSNVPAPTLIKTFLLGVEPAATDAARELASRLARATATDDGGTA